jgi:hypothetical protein
MNKLITDASASFQNKVETVKSGYLSSGKDVWSKLPPEDFKTMQMITTRAVYMANVKEPHRQRWLASQNYKDSFNEMFGYGENYNAPFRPPRAFGVENRLYAKMMKNEIDVKIDSVTRTPEDLACSRAIQLAVDGVKQSSNYRTEMAKCMRDVCGVFGNGILYIGHEYFKKKVYTKTAGGEFKQEEQITDQPHFERIDPRYFFIDDAALTLNEEGTRLAARDCIWDEVMMLSDFQTRYGSDKKFRNTDLVHGTVKSATFLNLNMAPHDAEAVQWSSSPNAYVHCYKYYNREQDMFVILANTIPIYTSRLDDNHKKLPFVHYQFYRRGDGPWADAPLTIILPILIKYDLLDTLAWDNMMLLLQPPIFLAGSVNIGQGTEMGPGAQIRVSDLGDRKLTDAIMPMQLTSLDKNYEAFRNILNDEMTLAIGDDARGLYANPDQLATQTNYKYQNLNDLLYSMIKMNEMTACKQEAEMIISNIKQYMLADGKDKKTFHVKVSGFKVEQSPFGTRIPTFLKAPNVEDVFELTKDLLDIEYRIVIESGAHEKQENDEAVKNWMQFFQMIMPIAQMMPDFAQKVDFYAGVVNLADRLGLEIEDMFPPLKTNSMSQVMNIINSLIMNQEPQLPPEPTIQMVQEMMAARDSTVYDRLRAGQKAKFDALISKLAVAVQTGAPTEQQMQQQAGQMTQQQANPQVRMPAGGMGQPPAAPPEGGQIATAATAKTIGQS